MRHAVRSVRARALLTLLLSLPASTASAQIAVVSETVQEHVATAGESYTATILVSNPTPALQAARIYQTDYRFAADGTSHFDPAGSLPRSNAQWVAPAVTQLVIPPGATVPIRYSVAVPADSALRGTYWSMLMVEGVASPAPTARNGTRNGIGIRPVVRYGIQVVTQMQPPGAPLVAFGNARATPDGARNQTLEFELHNTGERAFRPDVRVELYDETGALRASARQSRGLLYPGSSLLQRFTLEGVARQPHQVLVIVDAGDDQVFGANYTIRP